MFLVYTKIIDWNFNAAPSDLNLNCSSTSCLIPIPSKSMECNWNLGEILNSLLNCAQASLKHNINLTLDQFLPSIKEGKCMLWGCLTQKLKEDFGMNYFWQYMYFLLVVCGCLLWLEAWGTAQCCRSTAGQWAGTKRAVKSRGAANSRVSWWFWAWGWRLNPRGSEMSL